MADKINFSLSQNKVKPQKSFWERHSFLFSKKIVLFGLIGIIVLFLLQKSSFLSEQFSNLPPNDPAAIRTDTSTASEASQLASPADKPDLYIGPIRLNQSSYVREQLDDYVKEQASLESTESENNSESPLDNYSLKDIFSNPITSIAGITSSLKKSWDNDNRRTTLIKLVDSLSRYYLSYRTFPPADVGKGDDGYGWITEMVDKREMSGVYEYVFRRTSPLAYCGTLTQSGYCYKTDGKNAIVYVRLEKMGDAFLCGEENGVFFLWSSSDNKLGAVCLAGEPTQLQGFEYFKY